MGAVTSRGSSIRSTPAGPWPVMRLFLDPRVLRRGWRRVQPGVFSLGPSFTLRGESGSLPPQSFTNRDRMGKSRYPILNPVMRDWRPGCPPRTAYTTRKWELTLTKRGYVFPFLFHKVCIPAPTSQSRRNQASPWSSHQDNIRISLHWFTRED